MSEYSGPERRNGPKDRRSSAQDRRDEDRVANELMPRRNPDVPDRRKMESAQSAEQDRAGSAER